MIAVSGWLAELLVICGILVLQVEGSAVNPNTILEQDIFPRALANAPHGYMPMRVPCPHDGGRIRVASDLSPDEKAWLQKRRKNTIGPMKELLSRMKINGFDSNKYMDQISQKTEMLPNIGLAFSGGGYRAMLTGAGAFAAFDDRTPGSKDPGNLGGLLQASTYVAGLSGGGWLVGSVFINNFTSIPDLIDGGQNGYLWELDRSILEGPRRKAKIALLGTVDYLKHLIETMMHKKNANFDVSITDFWARAFSYQLVNTEDGGTGVTYSSISEQPGFPDGQIPMPILVSDVREPGQAIVSRNATVVEFNPYEMGSWDPALFGMAPLKYVGSRFEGGQVVNGECFAGLDNAGFVMGTSSSLFNEIAAMLVETAPAMTLQPIKKLMETLSGKLSNSEIDIASWSPNPFLGWRDGQYRGSKSKRFSLVDGGEDFQNIPLYPLIQPNRQVDVLFAVDSSGDTGNGAGWPNGTALIATYQRSLVQNIMNGTAFPAIPDDRSMINLGLVDRPSFFGCDAKNMSGPAPLIVYIPNHPYTYWSNISTGTSQLSHQERDGIIRNGYNVATMGNGSVDANWPQCVGCAILSRSFDRTKTAVPQTCRDCFKKHCWNGTLDTRPVKYEPPMVNPKNTATFTGKKKNAAWNLGPSVSAVVMGAVFAAAMTL